VIVFLKYHCDLKSGYTQTMSTRSEPHPALTPNLESFEVRGTFRGLSSWFFTFIPFLCLVEVLVRLVRTEAAWQILLIVYFLAVLFQARLFVLMHDCGHNRLTASHRLNAWLGHLSAFTYAVPFFYWRDLHNQHHKYQGNLEQRDPSFDLWTLTVAEYAASSKPRKLFYRFYRTPFSLFLIGPSLFFIFFLRWPPKRKSPASIKNILILNFIFLTLGILAIYSHELRLRAFVILSIAAFNFSLAVWLFYQQHVFTETYWAPELNFNNQQVSFQGSSFIQFPKWVNWFSASIGYHHIHHFNTKIPYYHLKAARQHLIDQKVLTTEKKLDLIEMLRNTQLKLWCEKDKKLIRFPN